MIEVLVEKGRPDFRVFIDLLFGLNRNVDSDGDSCPIYSRVWSCLYLKDRDSDEAFVGICANESNSKIFEVASESDRLDVLSALYLFVFCGDSIKVKKGSAL